MSKKTANTKPVAPQPVEKSKHDIEPQPAPTQGGCYVMQNGKLIKQKEG